LNLLLLLFLIAALIHAFTAAATLALGKLSYPWLYVFIRGSKNSANSALKKD
jgi:hypothetical protein